MRLLIVLVSDACERGSALHTMASTITQLAFDELDAPPVVVGARNWITPADEVEDAFFPFASDILDAVHTHVKPLAGYVVARGCDGGEIARRQREGVWGKSGRRKVEGENGGRGPLVSWPAPMRAVLFGVQPLGCSARRQAEAWTPNLICEPNYQLSHPAP